MSNLLSAIDPVAFSIGSLEVRWYGIILVSAMLVGLLIICIEGKRINLVVDDVIELFLWIVPLAIICARVFYVLPRPDVYFPWESWDDFVTAIAIWDGGITIIGAVLGGLAGIAIFTYRKRKKCNIGQVIDMAVPPLLLGQVIGRLGNFVNQEAFGIAIVNPKFQTFPFAVYIEHPNGVENMDLWRGEGWYAATFFYEMCWNMIGLSIAFAVWRKNKKYPGVLAFFYLFWYAVGRGLLEFIRLDAVPVTQVMCAVVAPIAVVLGLIYVLYRRSYLAFNLIERAVKDNLLYITEIARSDIKYYKIVSKMIKGDKNPLRYLYSAKDFDAVDIESMHYLDKREFTKAEKRANKMAKKAKDMAHGAK